MLMMKFALILLGTNTLLFASFSSSNSYNLNSYSVGPGGTNSAASSNYNMQGNAGEQAGNASSTTYAENAGSIQAEQLAIPPAPTLNNGAGTYYNKLGIVVNTGNNPTDATYAIAVSANNFTTTSYVQIDGTLSSNPVYQSYTAWGSSGGSYITGLSASAAYEVKAAAKEGQFTNTAYGPFATASTVAPSITFFASPSTLNLGNLLPSSVTTSTSVNLTLASNAASGGGVYITGKNSGLLSAAQSHTIPALSGNLASQSEGEGIQVSSATQTSGGPFSAVSPFNGTGNTVGAELTTPQELLSTLSAITGGSASVVMQAKSSGTTPTSADYQEALTFTASASF